MVNELKLIDGVDLLFDNTVVLYGAEHRGIETLNMLREINISPTYFCDGNPNKWGIVIEGLKVLSLLELKQLDDTESLAIIITVDQVCLADQIIKELIWLKLKTENVFTIFGLNVALSRSGKVTGGNGGYHNTILNMHRDVYSASWAARRLNERLKWADKANLFLAYSSPKTGTSTIRKSLLDVGISVDHFHGFKGADIISNPFQEELLLKYEKKCFEIIKTRNSVKIFCGAREPISRFLSLIFYLIGDYDFEMRGVPNGKPFADSIIDMVSDRKGEATDVFNWFDAELKPVFGIDVYAHPFNREKGYTIIKNENIEVFVFKLEMLISLESAIAEFAGVSRFKLANDNEADVKMYKYLYKRVRDDIRIPEYILDYYYKDPRMSHFYSKEEIADFVAKWSKLK